MESHCSTEKKKQWLKVMHKVNEMRANGTECDFTIMVDNNSLRVHRVVIRASSDYFDRMLTHDTLENQNSTVNMRDVDFASVKRCIDFMYTGEIDITLENVKGILHVSSLFQLVDICGKVSKILEKSLTASSFFEIRENSIVYGLEELRDVCEKYALENLETIVKEKKFGTLEVEYVISLLRNKVSSHRDSEDSKLAIILLWINADFDERGSQLLKMTECLNLARISPSYGLHVSETEKACYESSEFMKMLYTAQMKEHKYKAKEAEICFIRVPSSILLFDISNKELKSFDPLEKQTQTLAPLHDDLAGNRFYTACVIGNHCYVLVQNRTTFRIDVNAVKNGWEKRRNMTNEHDWITSVSVGEVIFVGGGDSMEQYSGANDAWSPVRTEGVICDQSSLAATNDYVFCVGGSNNGDVLRKVARLTISSMTWMQMKPSRHKRATPAVTIFNGILYVAGGIHRSFLSDVEAYDIKTNSWMDLSPLNECRNLFGLCCLNDTIYAVGKKKEVLTIESFDTNEKTWRDVDKDLFHFSVMALASVAF